MSEGTYANDRRVAIQGACGSFSHSAASRLVGAASFLHLETFAGVAAAVARGEADAGVLPAENSLVGQVADVAALLAEKGLSAVAELAFPIRQCLIAAAPVPLDVIREVRSHRVALEQCRRFLREHPWMAPAAAWDTAGAVREVCTARRPDLAAIGAARAAEVHGGVVLAEGIADHPDNVTRFVLFERRREA
jgi:prephenate dehydratase